MSKINNSNTNVTGGGDNLYSSKWLENVQLGWKDPTKCLKIEPEKKEALRYNSDKIRYDLLEPFALEQLAKVFTAGAKKYPARNWEKGMKWSAMLASLKRHIAAFERGEDVDSDTNCFHMAQAAWNAMGLVSYMKLYPEGDDRPHKYLRHPKIGLDIDNVICDWTKAWGEKHGLPTRPDSWHFSYGNKERFSVLQAELEEFYSTIPRQIDPNELPFEPHCYITARSIDEEITKKWIEAAGFPCAPIYTVPFMTSKVEVAKKAGIDWFIDDSFANFVELNNAGICTFLFDTPHNQRYDVGYKRIKSFKDFKERFLS